MTKIPINDLLDKNQDLANFFANKEVLFDIKQVLVGEISSKPTSENFNDYFTKGYLESENNCNNFQVTICDANLRKVLGELAIGTIYFNSPQSASKKIEMIHINFNGEMYIYDTKTLFYIQRPDEGEDFFEIYQIQRKN